MERLGAKKRPVADVNQVLMPGKHTCVDKQIPLTGAMNYHSHRVSLLMFDHIAMIIYALINMYLELRDNVSELYFYGEVNDWR